MMNKDTAAHIYHIFVVVTLICIAALLWVIKQNTEFNPTPIRPQYVRVINPEDITTSKNDKSVQDVRIVNYSVPIKGEVTINSEGEFGGVKVKVINDDLLKGDAIPIRVTR